MKALMAASGVASFDGLINLTFTFNGRPGDLLISTGSVDQTGNYVFAVQPEAAKKSAGKEIAFWSVADGSDTMISLWNPLNAAQDMAVTFHYADGSGEYRLPVRLPAKGDAMISVGELKMMGQPDLNGNTFSAMAQEGSAALTNLADPRGEQTVVVSAGTFNVRTATCGGGCTLCSGLTSVIVSGASSVAVGSTTQFSAKAYYSTGSSRDVTVGASWTTSNSSIATVNAGVVSGVAAGSAWITASYGGILGGVCPVPPTYDGGCQFATLDSPPQSIAVTTPSQHTYPNPPLTGCRVSVPFDGIINTTTGKNHQAQDTVGTNIQVGTPVYAPEGGTIKSHRSGQPHDPRPVSQCAGTGSPADFVKIVDASGNETTLVHVTMLSTLNDGNLVTAGQQIGTIDLSGCTSAPHSHIQRKVSGVPVNFTMPCDNSHFDDPGTYYDDSDSTIP